MNNNLKTWLTPTTLLTLMTLSLSVQAQNWPQPESAYLPSTQSPQWVENNMQQQPMPYTAPQYGYAPYNQQNYQPNYNQGYGQRYYPQPYYGNQNTPYATNGNWGSWPNRNNMMPSMPNMGNWSTPNMNMGNWSMPEMPNMNNMPGMPNMNNFSMPSPSFTTPTMNMPFFN
ncbi:hypothetical protein JCM30760_00060 [Thiomicrorhabdus hydrogeniphila]